MVVAGLLRRLVPDIHRPHPSPPTCPVKGVTLMKLFSGHTLDIAKLRAGCVILTNGSIQKPFRILLGFAKKKKGIIILYHIWGRSKASEAKIE